jgi:hypothetical protein
MNAPVFVVSLVKVDKRVCPHPAYVHYFSGQDTELVISYRLPEKYSRP